MNSFRQPADPLGKIGGAIARDVQEAFVFRDAVEQRQKLLGRHEALF